MKTLWLVGVISLLLAACSSTPSPTPAPTKLAVVASPTAIATPRPTQTATVTPVLTPESSIFDSADQIFHSPDGNFIAITYSQFLHPSGKSTLVVFNQQGAIKWVTAYEGENPNTNLNISRWSLDSKKLYFAHETYSYRDGVAEISPNISLYILDVETGIINEFLPDKAINAFAFSNDEQLIAYNNQIATIEIMNTTTKDTLTIDTKLSEGQIGWIHWSPNQNNLLFHVLSNNGWIRAIYLNLSTSEQEVIFEFGIDSYWPHGWASDDKPIYIRYPENELVTIDTTSKDYKISVIGTLTPTPVP